ncbi:hypothetical protein BD311DRAFT_761402 [Dichomitus squalens]|uniref:Uncharacterized protein n=1 Tax=Dichomitus squalens TaxID=114155 RepID=A0A4Q9MLL8_9APHY|nr:hypothetical protein BD311DRAFT_761402 [Dichomitus squalens]
MDACQISFRRGIMERHHSQYASSCTITPAACCHPSAADWHHAQQTIPATTKVMLLQGQVLKKAPELRHRQRAHCGHQRAS